MPVPDRALSVADLDELSDAELAALFERGAPLGQGIGGPTVRLDLADGALFVKRVPLSDLELEHPGSTANLFELPITYQYGVGSTGFSAWRELAAHERTTNYVLGAGTACFPVLHHSRVLPRRPGPVVEDHAHWAGSAAVRRRVSALEHATSSLALVLEFVPETLATWWTRQDVAATALELEGRLLAVSDALHDNDLLHLDAHAGNLLHDGRRLLLSDFGLATSADFELDDDERDFLARHHAHDRAYVMTRLVNELVARLVPGTETPAARNSWLAGTRLDPALPPTARDVIERHGGVAVLVNAFYWELHQGNLQTPYPYEEIDAAM